MRGSMANPLVIPTHTHAYPKRIQMFSNRKLGNKSQGRQRNGATPIPCRFMFYAQRKCSVIPRACSMVSTTLASKRPQFCLADEINNVEGMWVAPDLEEVEEELPEEQEEEVETIRPSRAPELDDSPQPKKIARVGGPVTPVLGTNIPIMQSTPKSKSSGKSKKGCKGQKTGAGKGGGKSESSSSNHMPAGNFSERWTLKYNDQNQEVWTKVAVGKGADWSCQGQLWK